MKKILFCQLCPFTYWLSRRKEILVRNIRDLLSNERFAHSIYSNPLDIIVSEHQNKLIKTGKDVDPVLQYNKAENIRIACRKINGLQIKPGEVFSFWKCVGKTSKANGFSDGRVIVNGNLVKGVGGGLCNLANAIHLVVIHSPLVVSEIHHHSDALSPDPDGIRIPYSAGTSVNYNYIDFRFKNDTCQPVQLLTWCDEESLFVELRSVSEYPNIYRIVEEGHHFHKEKDGSIYRVSKIYRETLDRKEGKVINKELIWDNHSKVLFDYALIPKNQLY